MSPKPEVKEEIKNNLYWKKKLKHIKNQIKRMAYENAALCDYTYETQRKYILCMERNNLILKRIQQHECIRLKETKVLEEKTPTSLLQYVLQKNATAAEQSNTLKKSVTVKKQSNSTDLKPPTNTLQKQRASSHQPEIKRKKITHQIPLDGSGQAIFPIELKGLSIHTLGEVTAAPGFNTNDIIYPVGFCSTRTYASTIKPTEPSLYMCTVRECDSKLRCEISSDTEPNMPIVGDSPDECHKVLLDRLLDTPLTPQGDNFFGLSHPIIHYLIQCSPKARKCLNYIPTKFQLKLEKDEEETDENNEKCKFPDFKFDFNDFQLYSQTMKTEVKQENSNTPELKTEPR